MEHKQITFDRFIRGVITVVIIIGIILLLNRLSNVLLPFFLAWLIAYLIFPLVRFFQYRCHLRYRIVGILLALLTVGGVLFGGFWLIVPPMIEETGRAKDMLLEYVQREYMVSNIPDQIETFLRKYLTTENVKAIVTSHRTDSSTASRRQCPESGMPSSPRSTPCQAC